MELDTTTAAPAKEAASAVAEEAVPSESSASAMAEGSGSTPTQLDSNTAPSPKPKRTVTFGPVEIITFHSRDTPQPTLLLRVGSRTAPKKLAFVGPVARQLTAVQEAAIATTKNKRLLKVKKGDSLQFFLPDGSELCGLSDELVDELTVLVAVRGNKQATASSVNGASAEV